MNIARQMQQQHQQQLKELYFYDSDYVLHLLQRSRPNKTKAI